MGIEASRSHRNYREIKADGSGPPGGAEIADKGLGFVKGFLARDPDGHGLQLIEK